MTFVFALVNTLTDEEGGWFYVPALCLEDAYDRLIDDYLPINFDLDEWEILEEGVA